MPVQAGSIDVEAVTLTVDGRTVEAATPGEAITITLTLRNNLDAAAQNVHVTAEEPPQGLRFSDAEATAGDIAPGQSGVAKLVAVVEKDGCTDFAGFGGEITYDGGSAPMKVGFPVACPGPRLSLENVVFSGGDGDGVPEPGETVRATIVLRNDGRDAATGVRARVAITSGNASTQNDDLAWADIDPRASARSSSPLTLVIDDDAARQKGCEGVSILPAPVEDGGSVPPDTAVSSDGTVSTPAANASDLPASSEPGSSAGAPGSTGSGTPTVVEPTSGTGTVEPEPSTEPVPEPGTIEPQPEPAPEDQPAAIALKLTVTASGYETTLDYSNQTFCAVEGRTLTDTKRDAAGAPTAADDASGVGAGVATPLVVAGLVAAAAVGARRFLILR